MEALHKNYTVIINGESSDKVIQVPSAIKDDVADLFLTCVKGKVSAKEKVLKLINRYPKAPFLKLCLAHWYSAKGNGVEADRIYDELMRDFPDFVFAPAQRLARWLDAEDIEAVDKYFGDNFDIGYHFPGRREFDLAEYRSFMENAIIFLGMTGRFVEAAEQVTILKNNDKDSELADKLEHILNVTKAKLIEAEEEYEDEDPFEIFECTLPQRNERFLPTSPEFDFLYQKQWEIDAVLLQNAIENNKEALLAEIHHIIISAIECAKYCYIEEIWTPAVVHALLLSPYIDDERTFEDLLLFFRQPEDYISYWINNWHENCLHPYFKTFSLKKLQAIKKFLLQNPGNENSKVIIGYLISEFVVYSPGCREMVIETMKEILGYFLANDNKDPINLMLVAAIILAGIEIDGKELLEQVRELYTQELIPKNLVDMLEKSEFNNNKYKNPYKYEVFDNVYDQLAAVIALTEGNEPDDIEQYEDKKVFDQVFDRYIEAEINKKKAQEEKLVKNIFANTPKNAPCPCGSGKKYKRCHGI